eukprot:m.339396 g.339396  ORF g.339396 m.339396 type:complete len:181 (+) comp20583_c1_seq3:1487-2029(+)
MHPDVLLHPFSLCYSQSFTLYQCAHCNVFVTVRGCGYRGLRYDAGEGKWGTETSVFRRILCVRSVPQLRCIFQEYDKICKYTIEQSCKREMSGNLLKGVRTIIRFAEDHHLYFATVLYKSMKGLGTDDRQLVRTVVSRCEYDMVEIKQAFQRKYGKPLSKMIRGDCSGDYKECLLRLIGE